jgi:ABC-2 type transport system permease protein
MNRALAFLLLCSIKNRILLRLKRLRQPKYLISVLVGCAYLYFFFFQQLFKTQIPQMVPGNPAGTIPLAETVLAFLLLVLVVFQWFFPSKKMVLFSESEIQFLFPSPISRAALIHYRIVRAQSGVIMGTIISSVLFGRGHAGTHPGFLFVSFWLAYSFLSLYQIAILLRNRNRKVGTWTFRIFLFAVILMAVWIRWFINSSPQMAGFNPPDFIAWMKVLADSGPIFYLLLPFRWLLHPAFASNLPEFALALVPALAVVAIVYGWIRSVPSINAESGVGPDERIADIPGSESAKQRTIIRHSRRPPFILVSKGFAPIALYWKNLSMAGMFNLRKTIPVVSGGIVLAIVILNASGGKLPVIVGSIAAGLAGFMIILGPVLFRDDLRADLKNVDLLKTYPMCGWEIILGEVLAPISILTVLGWMLVLLATSLLTGFDVIPWKAMERVSIGLSAIFLLPCFSSIGVLIQNATVLMLPGWFHLGKEHTQGVEAMGQRLITSIATTLFLVITALPAAGLFLVVFLIGYKDMDLAIVPFASLAAAMVLLFEAGLGIFLLGKLFDKLDASQLNL